MRFTQNQEVEIHSLGPSYGDKTFAGYICGLAVDFGDTPATVWIVHCPFLGKDVPTNGRFGFTHVTMPQACLREVRHDEFLPGQV